MNQISPCDELISTEQRHSMLHLDDILEVSEIYQTRLVSYGKVLQLTDIREIINLDTP